MIALFGSDERRRLPDVANPLGSMSGVLYSMDFYVICDDLMVNLRSASNGQLEWVDDDHRWSSNFARFKPCDPTRKPNVPHTTAKAKAYTLFRRYIYLCPEILDNPKGRVLRPYKDLDLLGSYFEHYVLLPVVILHGKLHFSPFQGEFLFRSRNHIV